MVGYHPGIPRENRAAPKMQVLRNSVESPKSYVSERHSSRDQQKLTTENARVNVPVDDAA